MTGLIAAEQIAVCEHVCDERTDDVARLAQQSHLKTLGKTLTKSNTYVSFLAPNCGQQLKRFSVCQFTVFSAL